MAYPPRQYHSGYWYHVFTRQQRGAPLFYEASDRRQLLSLINRYFCRHGAKLGAFCLMTNHYHLLVRMGEEPLGKIFQTIHMNYAKYFNRQHSGDGNLFKDRPGVKIILEDSYLIQLVRYIHRNPVEAELVSTVKEYDWSSDARYRGGSPVFDFECWEFPPFFQGREGVRLYKEKIGESIDPDNWEKGENFLGTESEWEKLSRRKLEREGEAFRDRRGRPTLEEIAEELTEGSRWKVDDLKKPGRGQERSSLRQKIMVRMYEKGYGPTEIGQFFNRTKAAVTYALNNYKT